MTCHILFSGKNKKNISKCRLLKILPRVLSVKFSCMYLTDPADHQKDLDEQIGVLDNKVADLEAENEALKEERTILKERVRVGCPFLMEID